MKTHHLEISGGLGPSVGLVRDDVFTYLVLDFLLIPIIPVQPDVFGLFQVLRVGLMGCNSSKASVDMVLAALKDALTHCHKSKV